MVRLIARLLAFLGILISIIGLGRLWHRQSEITEYRRAGKHLQGTVLAADVSYSKDGRRNYRRYDYVNFRTTLDGKPLETTLDNTQDIVESLKPGQQLEVVYLESGKWQNANGQLGFFDDHKPVPLAYIHQSPFSSSYAYLVYGIVLGTAGLLWLGWRR